MPNDHRQMTNKIIATVEKDKLEQSREFKACLVNN